MHPSVLSSIRATGTQPDVERITLRWNTQTICTQTYGHVKKVLLYSPITMKLAAFHIA